MHSEIASEIAEMLLLMVDAELARDCRVSYVPKKSRVLHRDEWETVRDTGFIPPKLYAFLLMYRARLAYQNQTVEGIISIMQRFGAAVSSRATRPGVSDRLRNKLGDSIS